MLLEELEPNGLFHALRSLTTVRSSGIHSPSGLQFTTVGLRMLDLNEVWKITPGVATVGPPIRRFVISFAV